MERSDVLGVFVLLWFFLVPVPGLTVFGESSHPETYRFTLSLGGILRVVGCVVVLALAASLLGRCIQWLDLNFSRATGLKQRLIRCFGGLRDSQQRYTPEQTAKAFALLTDTQTYIEQRSFAHARRSLRSAESILESR